MKALIIVDMQNDFITGSLATDPKELFTKRTAQWIGDNKYSYDYIATTQDWHIDPQDHFETWPVHCVAGTKGSALHTKVIESLYGQSYHRFLKGQYADGYSGFDGVSADSETLTLEQWLKDRSVETVDILGIATDHCVRATAVDAVEKGFTARVLGDYVNGVDADTSQELLSTGFAGYGVEVIL